MRFYLGAIILVAAITYWQADFWGGPKGLTAVWSLQKDITVTEAENQKLEAKNKTLYREVKSLKTSDVMVEEKARFELGLIKKGEQFYQIAQPKYVP